MRRRNLIWRMALVVLLAGVPASAGETIKVGVKGMVCAFCAQGIQKKFSAQPEVASVKVSLEQKFIELSFVDGKSLAKERIGKLLSEAGYEMVNLGTEGAGGSAGQAP